MMRNPENEAGFLRAAIFLTFLLALWIAMPSVGIADPPSSYDLRDVGGTNYVTSVKSQTGGTCWTHGAMAAIEGNLLMTGAWIAAGESGEPNLAEYHLDWWNGFNQHNNDDMDPPSGSGLVVHEGGDYLVTSAYLSRGEGAVRDIDGQSYGSAPLRDDPAFHHYYVRDIEWFTVGENLVNINTIKEKIMSEGVMGTCLCYDASFMVGYTHYQPPTSMLDPNHAVAIVGWDDDFITHAPLPGAWLCKNSWGADWGNDGYFWISYYDKHCGHHPEMGAVTLTNVEPLAYDHFYYHDYHGWRDTKTDCDEAFNAFVAEGSFVGLEMLKSVSFYTAADSVNYTVKIYNDYTAGELQNELAVKTGFGEFRGFRTIDLDNPIELTGGDDFYVYLKLSSGGQPYDRTSDVPVLLGANYRTIVPSSASPGQSYYRISEIDPWQDFYEDDSTGNFCIKALTIEQAYLNINLPNGLPEILEPGVETSFTVEITDGIHGYLPGTGQLHYRFDGGAYLTAELISLGGTLFEATLPAALCEDIPEFYLSADGIDKSTVYSPADAPNTVYSADVGMIEIYIDDDFETDLGWTVQNLGATSGLWQRGIPIGDPDWPYGPTTDGDGSGQCYVTDNGMGNTDIDGGAVRLISPVFDMLEGGSIEYEYYFCLNNTTGTDSLLLEINNAGGVGTWVNIASHKTDGGSAWRHHEISQAELILAGVAFTDNMQIRFTANDGSPASVVEAGVDGVMITRFYCVNPEPPYICGDATGDEEVNVSDAVHIINYVFVSGNPPDPMESGDADCSGEVNVSDAVWIINYVFVGGNAPCDTDGDGEPDC
jgi:C1A family cysteine protease